MKKLTAAQAADCITQIVELAHRLRILEPTVRERAGPTGRDGYPPTSGPNAGHGSGGGDPVGNLVALRLDHPQPDPLATAHVDLCANLEKARRLLEEAESTGRQVLPFVAPISDDGCISCARLHRWSPIHRTRRCRFCYEYLRAESADPPAALVRAHLEGRRITTSLVIRLQQTGAI